MAITKPLKDHGPSSQLESISHPVDPGFHSAYKANKQKAINRAKWYAARMTGKCNWCDAKATRQYCLTEACEKHKDNIKMPPLIIYGLNR